MSAPLVPLIIEARRLLMLSQGALGEKLGSSRRTGQRWESGTVPSAGQLHTLAGLVYSHDATLAAQIASAGGTTLEALGIVPPPPATLDAPPAAPVLPPEFLADTVVCAAAEAMNVTPGAIRPALLAAFRRARLVGLSLEAMEKALHAAPDERAR